MDKHVYIVVQSEDNNKCISNLEVLVGLMVLYDIECAKFPNINNKLDDLLLSSTIKYCKVFNITHDHVTIRKDAEETTMY